MMIERIGSFFSVVPELLPPEPRVLQIGAFSLDLAGRVLLRWPRARVVVVEPASTNFERLVATRSDALPVRLIRAALCDQNGQTTLYRFRSRGAHSLWPMHEHTAQSLVECETVRACTLRTILDLSELGHVHLAMLNCEGAELFALRELAQSPGLAEKFDQLSVATHWLHYPVYSQADLQDAIHALRSHYQCERRVFAHRGAALEYIHLIRRDLK